MFDWVSSLPQTTAHFEAGQYLFHRDDAIQHMHLIVDGRVLLLRRKDNGSAIVLQRASAGAVLAEASLFVESYHCDAIAQSPATALKIERDAVRHRFMRDPEFARAWATHLSSEVRNARRRAEILSQRTVAERLDAWLAEGRALPAKGQWREIAEEIGTTPEALYRELSRRRLQ